MAGNETKTKVNQILTNSLKGTVLTPRQNFSELNQLQCNLGFCGYFLNFMRILMEKVLLEKMTLKDLGNV